jgi:hypothetical protein
MPVKMLTRDLKSGDINNACRGSFIGAYLFVFKDPYQYKINSEYFNCLHGVIPPVVPLEEGVSVGITVGSEVRVGTGESVGMALGVSVAPGFGDAVGVVLGVAVADGRTVGVGEGVGVVVGIGVGEGDLRAYAPTARNSRTNAKINDRLRFFLRLSSEPARSSLRGGTGAKRLLCRASIFSPGCFG